MSRQSSHSARRNKPIIISEGHRRKFYAKVCVSGNGCHIWRGGVCGNGYGAFCTGKHTQYMAHRVAYYLHFGVDPAEWLVCHHCDVPLCVNPAHLFLGSSLDNAADCASKGRKNAPSGDDHWSRREPDRVCRGSRHMWSKLTENDVATIHELFETGEWTKVALGRRFGIKRHSVARILARQRWKHI